MNEIELLQAEIAVLHARIALLETKMARLNTYKLYEEFQKVTPNYWHVPTWPQYPYYTSTHPLIITKGPTC